MESGANPNRTWILLAALVTLGLLAGGIAFWFTRKPDGNPDGDGQAEAANAERTEKFFVGLAALDVEENQRAATLFAELSASLPQEPAVWANLGIAQLRLNEIEAAEQALTEAAKLAPNHPEIVELQAIAAERVGNLDRAIELLRSIPNPDAEALYLLGQIVARTGEEQSLAEQLAIIHQILEQQPENLVARFSRARLAARLENASELNEALSALAERRETWNEQQAQQFAEAGAAAQSGDFRKAATHLAFLENLSKPAAPYQEALAALGVTGASVGAPVRNFLELAMPRVRVAEADLELRFELRPAPDTDPAAKFLLAHPGADDKSTLLVRVVGSNLHVDRSTAAFPGRAAERPIRREQFSFVDLNADFRQDLVVATEAGLLLLLQDEAGGFAPYAGEELPEVISRPAAAVWSLDFEADGDMDLAVVRTDGSVQLARNNGDMTFAEVNGLEGLTGPRSLHWADLDNDGGVDLVGIIPSGQVVVLWNQRGGKFSQPQSIAEGTDPFAACAVGDLDQDGMLEVITLDAPGSVHAWSYDAEGAGWSSEKWAEWSAAPGLAVVQSADLWLGDLDNNGALDVIANSFGRLAIWLHDGAAPLKQLEGLPNVHVTSLEDIDGDGGLDLVGNTRQGPHVAYGRGKKEYHWQAILPRANPNVADKRINTFGLGGRIEVRAGRMLLLAPIDSPRVHVGLGNHPQAGVARIVWPNGVVQAEFDLAADQVITSQQRLKGSCPFVFARDGETFHFVKDFIWRSPLGLKINSQDTAGVHQTEDWIKIPGELLSERDGTYELRITAELWETHFFDLVSLMVVDHPDSVEAHVDERFIARRSPAMAIVLTSGTRPLTQVRDQDGKNVAKTVRAIDGDYLDTFKLGAFQGIAEEHFVEFTLDEDLNGQATLYLVGHGWIYPTDSSLNVAISQGDFPPPQGLVLDAWEEDGGWKAVSDDLGFPAGKNKTVLIELPADLLQRGQRRFRLRTNLEVYWDLLGVAAAEEGAEAKTVRVSTKTADLRHRGFSQLSPLSRRRPDIPRYDRLIGTGQRWRDLAGYYTRFGDVRELLHEVDDRYVIMNAGDEIILEFEAPPPPPAGWRRDFVLIGDGWVKDGDYNTTQSKTVHPLPTHERPEYSDRVAPLHEDPIYQKHRGDWERFHTRYITPRHFERGLWSRAGGATAKEDNNEHEH